MLYHRHLDVIIVAIILYLGLYSSVSSSVNLPYLHNYGPGYFKGQRTNRDIGQPFSN